MHVIIVFYTIDYLKVINLTCVFLNNMVRILNKGRKLNQ